MLKIGALTLKSNVILSSLLYISDLTFRSICRMSGCEFAFYEPIDAYSLVHNRKKALQALCSNKFDKPIGAQIIGREPDIMLEAAHIILNHSNPEIIDLNFACPMKSVLKKRCGAYLINEPEKIAHIVKKLSSSIDIPITIKIRSGYLKSNHSESLKLARMAEDSGAKGVFFHGRSMQQGFSGKIDYEAIKKVKQALKIPVIGSGDILSGKLAKKMLDRTGCDGIVVARGAMGNPWIFNQIKTYLNNPSIPVSPVSYKNSLAAIQEYIGLYVKNRNLAIYRQDYLSLLHKIIVWLWYAKGISYLYKTRIICNILHATILMTPKNKGAVEKI